MPSPRVAAGMVAGVVALSACSTIGAGEQVPTATVTVTATSTVTATPGGDTTATGSGSPVSPTPSAAVVCPQFPRESASVVLGEPVTEPVTTPDGGCTYTGLKPAGSHGEMPVIRVQLVALTDAQAAQQMSDHQRESAMLSGGFQDLRQQVGSYGHIWWSATSNPGGPFTSISWTTPAATVVVRVEQPNPALVRSLLISEAAQLNASNRPQTPTPAPSGAMTPSGTLSPSSTSSPTASA